LFIFVLGKVDLESLGKFAPGKHDTPSTTFAFQPDIRAKTCDDPFIGATRMLLSEAKMIVETKIR
jgi:hypothetical protein